MMDDLESSVDSDKSGMPSKCPRLITDDDRTFTELTEKIDVNRHMVNYTHLNDITDLRHESLNQLLKNNIELMKNENIELKPIASRSKIVYVDQHRNIDCGCVSVNCRHENSASDHNNNGSCGNEITAASLIGNRHRSECAETMCHRRENLRHHHMHTNVGGSDSANNMLIDDVSIMTDATMGKSDGNRNGDNNAAQYSQLIDDESKHCNSIDDKLVSSSVDLLCERTQCRRLFNSILGNNLE